MRAAPRLYGCLALAMAWTLSAPPCFADPPPGATPQQGWDAAQRCRDGTQTEAAHTACVVRALSGYAPKDAQRLRATLETMQRALRGPPAVRPDAPALPPDRSQQ